MSYGTADKVDEGMAFEIRLERQRPQCSRQKHLGLKVTPAFPIILFSGRKTAMKSKISTSLLVILLVSVSLSGGQEKTSGNAPQESSIEAELKPIFQEWERPDRPGGVVAIMEKGEIVYKKSFGLANIEYRQPNTSQTVFDVSSLAEPITGMAIAMLEEQGKLTASEPVRKYIPELPECMGSVTIAHLLYHTSGLVDWFDLLTLAGWDERDVITTDHVFKLLQRQKDLLFAPGSEYRHSRTDYTLLAELVKRVTDKPFRDWTWENIFRPLGMIDTLFRDNPREILENRAYSINYHYRDGYLKGADNLGVVGANSLYTSLDDFIKWISNIQSQKLGPAAVLEKMLTSGKLSDGKDAGHSYGFRTETKNGLKRILKDGFWGGFHAAFRYYPDVSFAVVIFSNWDYSWYSPANHAENVVNVCLKSYMQKEEKAKPGSEKKEEMELSPIILGQYQGEFRLQPGTYMTIKMEDENLMLFLPGGQKYRLTPVSESEFLFLNQFYTVSFHKDQNDQISHLNLRGGSQDFNAPRIERVELNHEQLKLHEGTYYNEETDSRYEIRLGEKGLVITSLRGGDVSLTPESRNYFIGNSLIFRLIAFSTDESGEIAGFRIDSDNLQHFIFKKLKE